MPPSSFGRSFGLGKGFAPVDRPVGTGRSKGIRAERGRGGANFPTVLEAYNRDSDFKRWRAGKDLWEGSTRGWADLEQAYLVRSFRDFGAEPGPWLTTVTFFPSNNSPEGNWTVVTRRRGAVILPQPLLAGDIVLDTSHPVEGRHRLILDVSGTLSAQQLESWKDLVGDQFEDSATGVRYPRDLIREPIDTIAYTLTEVDVAGSRLLFDLSRPFMRRRPSEFRPRAFWQKIRYQRELPLSWRNDGSRYLCSSHKFYCTCPDHSAVSIADFTADDPSIGERFPLPSAGRPTSGRWEREQAGYLKRWRDLPRRSDQRRECKHIHAARWSLGYPFYEPSDYEVGRDDRFLAQEDTTSLPPTQRYQRRRGYDLDRVAFALAAASGVEVDARDSIPEDEEIPAIPGRPPILWTSEREPAAARAREDDWWLRRGGDTINKFSPSVGRFVETIEVGDERKPVFEPVEANSVIPSEVTP
jgi:hypothetical protein